MPSIRSMPAVEDDADPSLKDPGRILVHIRGPHANGTYKHDYEVLSHEGSAHWIQEGVGFDYWLDEFCMFPGPGHYVVEGIVGSYTRGDGVETDDDEDWEFERIRPATEAEIRDQDLGSVDPALYGP